MDPLSISMAILAVIGATTATIKKAKSIYKAPEELESLQNDLSDAELMVCNFQSLHQIQAKAQSAQIRDVKSFTENQIPGLDRPANDQETALQERLVVAQRIVDPLRTLVDEVLGTPDSVRRRMAWAKAKKKTRRLTQELARIHDELPRRHGQAEGSRITLGLGSISEVQIEMNLSLARLETQADATSQSVSQLRDAVLATQALQGETVSTLTDLREDTTERLQSLESTISTNNEIQQHTSHQLQGLESAISTSNNLHQRTSQRLQSLESTISMANTLLQALPEVLQFQIQTTQSSTLMQSSIRGSDGHITDTTTSMVQSAYQSVMIKSHYRHPNLCELSCHCRCHFPRTLDSPSFLGNILGRIFVGYKGIPAIATKCTDPRCKNDSEPKVYLTYYFPKWWVLSRTVILLAQWTIARGPELLLRFPRRVGANASIFQIAQNGDIDGLKQLLGLGLASPNDVDHLNKTALIHAFSHEQYDTVKFLIQAGTDTNLEEDNGSTFEDLACQLAFSKTRNSQWTQWATESFVVKRSQPFEFSALHEVLLGLRYTSLEEEMSRLSASPNAIDKQDVWGRTPLYWASSKGNFQAVCQLLRFGADPNILSSEGKPPLHATLALGKLDCAMRLIQHGANIHHSSRGWTALHYVCAYIKRLPSSSKTTEFLDTLFYMGIDINALLTSGATSLHLSLQSPGNFVLLWLLNHGADHRIKKSRCGMTILHQAGSSGDLETIQILRNANLSDIDINARTYDMDMTAMDEMLTPIRGIPASEELKESFRLLLAEIEARTNGVPLPMHEVRQAREVVDDTPPTIPEESTSLSEDSEDHSDLPNSTPFIPLDSAHHRGPTDNEPKFIPEDFESHIVLLNDITPVILPELLGSFGCAESPDTWSDSGDELEFHESVEFHASNSD